MMPGTIYGRRIIISSSAPRMVCSPRFCALQSPELVASTNAWMESFFGRTEVLADGQVMSMESIDAFVMNQRTYNQLMAAMPMKESA